MPYVAVAVPELLDRLRDSAHLDGDRLVVDDEPRFRGDVIRDLAWTAAWVAMMWALTAISFRRRDV